MSPLSKCSIWEDERGSISIKRSEGWTGSKMNRKHVKGWMKHGDFIIIDIILLQVCYMHEFDARKELG